jgi:outer membrane protein assembly factor BamB
MRRLTEYFVGAGSVVAIATVLSGCAASQSTAESTIGAESWPMYQRFPDHNAVLGAGPAVRWTYGAHAKINGGLAVVAGAVIFDTFAGSVVSLDAANGNVRWTATADNVVMSTPVVESGVVVVGTGRNGAMGAPHASFVYDPNVNQDADEVWGRPEGDHELAFDLATGRRLWSYRTAGEDMPSPAIARGLAIFANGDQHAYALRLRTGEPVWRSDIEGVSTMASANASGGLVLVAGCNLSAGSDETRALDVASGSTRWRVSFGNCDAAPAVALGIAFLSDVSTVRQAGAYSGRAFVTAVDVRSGRIRWRYTDPSFGRFSSKGSSERAIAGTYCAGLYLQPIPTSNSLVALDARTGALRWRFRSYAPIKMSPVASQNVVYAGDTSGRFYEIIAANGKLLRSRTFGEPFTTSPPVLAGKTIFIATTDTVQAIAP